MVTAKHTHNGRSWPTYWRRRTDHYSGFFEEVSELASASIKRRLRRLPPRERARIRQLADLILRDPALRKGKKLRGGAARVIVALLPETFSSVKQLLSDSKSRLWHEVHFIIFAALDRKELGKNDQTRVLKLIYAYLKEAKSDAGYAAWEAGLLLGDEWRSEQTVQMLEELLFSAKYPSGRKSALHGIKHALTQASPAQRTHLFSLIERVANEDRSATVRLAARLDLHSTQCGPAIDSLSDKRG
ncbi:MAG: hypothetical protein WB995_19270 [Candidatus Acidiferrales bacterium]